ncbi:MAG: UDP-3-O-(3-hydroxymyristoyl)glucosamine N-acyltransferase [Desulfobacter sp.]|nr:UDP-3-O-(3-hydroxymyristoyl)glucosamine N-acyltransferase [Desulfobacter sp.]WDP86357.1 MAG: UDP-3-O-(3-hydroxymyristoyl)glucosamine N-acyltransferase [Desulfobacter sp.]
MLTTGQISQMVDACIQGESEYEIHGVCSFDDAGPMDLTFAVDHGYLSRLDLSKAGAVLVPQDFSTEKECTAILLKSANPKVDFFKIVEYFSPKEQPFSFVHPTAVIGDRVRIGQDTRIDANVVVGNDVVIGDKVHIMANTYVGDQCRIKDSCQLKPNVTLMDKTQLGVEVLIHSGTVIGSDGFGFAMDSEGHAKLVHTGSVHIGDRVEIGACNTIDKGTLGVTSIGNGVKTDNLIHIAHNVKIGDNTLVVAQVGIAGSTVVGNNVIIAGKSAVSGHLTIGDGAIVGPFSAVSKDVPPNEVVSGIPHMPHKIWLKVANIISRLPAMRTKLLSLEKRIKEIESKDTE